MNYSYQKLRFCDFVDWDFYNQQILGWQSQFWQNSAGKVKLLYEEINFKFLSIYYDIYNQGFLASGVIPNNRIYFFIPLEPLSQNLGIFCANSFDTNSLLIARSDSQYDAFIPQSIAGLSLLITPEFFKSHTDSTQQVFLDELIQKNVSHLKVDPGLFMNFKNFLKNLYAEIQLNYQPLAKTPSRQEIIQERVLEQLTKILSRPKTEIILRTNNTSHILAKSAREFIESHYEQPLTIKEVCQAIGANERTLRYSFKAIFGLSPKQYLRIHRLNLAHQQLLRGNSTTKSVTDIAFDSGLWHLGRFSRDYKELFEELPVETLRKAVSISNNPSLSLISQALHRKIDRAI